MRTDTDVTKMQNITSNNSKSTKREDSVEMLSDAYDSDSKENEQVRSDYRILRKENFCSQFVDVGQTLSASFRLRVQQKTQEKIEQKERRRQDREQHRRQLTHQSNGDNAFENDFPLSSASTSRYSSQPDLSSLGNDLPPTPRRQIESNITSILPNVPSQQRSRILRNS